MFTPGSILHGTFTLKAITKEKFSIVLYNDGFNCILTTFTTSEDRSGVSNPVHGKNPEKGAPLSYVFKKGIVIGELYIKGCKNLSFSRKIQLLFRIMETNTRQKKHSSPKSRDLQNAVICIRKNI